MATKIRLKRLGKIREPHYRIVVMDSRTKRDGRAIEEIGQYHPMSDPSVLKVNSERVQYWLGVGAQPTEAVVAILKRTGDWQQFTGDTSIPSGINEADPKPDKAELFNKALAEEDDEPAPGAISLRKSKGADDASADDAEAPTEDAAEEAPADDADRADAPEAAAEAAEAEADAEDGDAPKPESEEA